MELKDLVGRHYLTGVDQSDKQIKLWGSSYEDCNVINFVLDGKTYTAIEDPSDGYRSAMKEITISDESVSNTFPPVEVMGKMRGDSIYEANDVIEFWDIENGKLVLAVGTANYKDYYPYWVAEFNPQDMSINTNPSQG